MCRYLVFILWISGGVSATGAIAGGVAAGAALLFAAPAILFAWWRRRKPQEYFFDVPGQSLVLSNFYLGILGDPCLHFLVSCTHHFCS